MSRAGKLAPEVNRYVKSRHEGAPLQSPGREQEARGLGCHATRAPGRLRLPVLKGRCAVPMGMLTSAAELCSSRI